MKIRSRVNFTTFVCKALGEQYSRSRLSHLLYTVSLHQHAEELNTVKGKVGYTATYFVSA